MADVILAKRLFDDRTQLPRVCISCGKPATTDFEIRTLAKHPASTAPAHDTSALGCLLIIFDIASLFASMAAATQRPSLSVPVCRYHRWVVPPSTYIKSISDDTIELASVSPEFVAQLPKQAE